VTAHRSFGLLWGASGAAVTNACSSAVMFLQEHVHVAPLRHAAEGSCRRLMSATWSASTQGELVPLLEQCCGGIFASALPMSGSEVLAGPKLL
jgi:hypothetical protein